MKKYELEATKDNLIKTLKDNCIGRNSEIADFLMLLDGLEGSISISLDANWGNGKTFFTKHLEILLNYFREKTYNTKPTHNELDHIVSNDEYLRNIQMNNTFIPIYYDAWLYDNHSDPLLSLIFAIIKKGYIKAGDVTENNLRDKIAPLVTLVLSMTKFNINIEKLIETKDFCLDTIFNEEKIKSLLKSIFDEIIIEKCNKLIIIIDELDRCRPDYTVKMLERIKHFYDDERIVFLFSTNKEQLVHTIKNFYGYNFDASSYFNRFFDFQFTLTDINIDNYLNFIDSKRSSTLTSQKIASQIGLYYRFSIREYNIYYQNIKKLNKHIGSRDGLTYIVQVFGPIICALRIKDIEKERKFLSGNLLSELEEVLSEVSSLENYAMRSISQKDDVERKQMIRNLYYFLFKGNGLNEFTTDGLEVYNFQRDKLFGIINSW